MTPVNDGSETSRLLTTLGQGRRRRRMLRSSPLSRRELPQKPDKSGSCSSQRNYFTGLVDSVTLVLHTLAIFRSAPETTRFAETPQIRVFCCLRQPRSHPKIKNSKRKDRHVQPLHSREPLGLCRVRASSRLLQAGRSKLRNRLWRRRDKPHSIAKKREVPKPQPGAPANVRFPPERGTVKRDEN